MDTYSIALHQDEFSFPDDQEFDWSEAHIQFLVNLALSELDVGIPAQTNFRTFGVSEIVPGVRYSKAGYIESENGYFIISEDMMLHITVTYSRWD